MRGGGRQYWDERQAMTTKLSPVLWLTQPHRSPLRLS